MPPYKRQHYLPASYLRYFSADQSRCTRDSLIWRFDGETQRLVPVKSQCAADYHFSRTKAAETEHNFQIVEDLYCQCVNKIKLGNIPTGNEYGNLLLMLFELH